MPDKAPEALIREVDQTIKAFSPINIPVLSDSDKLESKIRLYKYQRRALAPPFQRIAVTYKTSGTNPQVTGVACENLKSVKDARSLVARQSGHSYSGEGHVQ